MATSVKDKNMPNISSNIYGGLQKWVNRASLTIRRTRRNSDVSQTPYKPNSSEMNGSQDYNQGKIVPFHGRSRSTPVMMPDPENYLDTIDQSYRKTSEETKTSLQQEALLEPWGRRESKDDMSKSQKERKNTVGGKPLRRSCSKSESSLIEAAQKYEALRLKSKTSPPKQRVRRLSSTDGSIGSSTSDLDVNYNTNKKSRATQALRKANKRERAQTLGHKIDSNGGNRLNEKLRKESSHDKIARDVKARLDRWVDKTAGFHDSRQSSFESTSSSDDLSDILVLKRDNNQTLSNETREMRELQNALEELVSSCCRGSSRKSSDGEPQTADSIEAINTRASRKISLKDAGSMFSKTVDTDYQSVRQDEYRIKKCGSSSGSAGSGSSNMDVFAPEKQRNSELEESYDSVDGKAGEIEGSGIVETKDSVSCDIDIGRGSQESLTRVSTAPENLESEINNQNNHVSSLESVSQNQGEYECQQENQQSRYYEGDNSSLPNETKQTETNEQFSKQNLSVGGMKDDIEDVSRIKPPRSTKSYRAPLPPSTKDSQEKKSKLSDVIFNDISLDAFAEECLRQADQKKKKTKERDRESKSDSEEEKRGLKINFVYIKRDANEENLAQSYPEQMVRKKAATHPKTSFDNHHIALSDNELDRNEIPLHSKIREKRNSADSLDGRVLFNLTPHYDTDNTDSKNEDDHSSDGLHTEEEQATESTRPGMRKFPSMPLFYVPKEFDQSGEFKRIKSASIRKSLWKRIKSLPRHSAENNRVQQNNKSKRKEEDTTSAHAQFVDPFYHGEKEDEYLQAPFRTKAWTLSGAKISLPVSQSRPSLEPRRSAPVIKVEAGIQQRDRILNDYVVIPPRSDDESQC